MAIVTQSTKFKVPRENNTVLLWAETPLIDLLRHNRAIRSEFPHWLQSLTETARSEILPLMLDESQNKACCCSCASQRSADGITGQFTDESTISNVDSWSTINESTFWILGGHQPELFHPGVWYKNFYLDWARKHLSTQGESAIGLHLIVDHDLARSTSIRSTRFDQGRLFPSSHIMPVATGAPAPWEATYYQPQDERAWEAWIDGLIEDSESIGIDPMIKSHRQQFMALLRETNNVGEAFSRFRHLIEEANDCDNYELAMSRVTSTSSFGEFLRRCLMDAERFFEIYNNARENFRSERGITNPAQPVAELHRHGEWYEMPFWIYEKSSSITRREKLWVRRIGLDSIELVNAPLDLDVNADSSHLIHRQYRLDELGWAADWESGIEASICIRPRALTNTLFLRYVVADLFVHGIGGGIYDAVTDEIANKLWDLKPLAMQVVSASLFLPIAGDAVSDCDVTQVAEPILDERESLDRAVRFRSDLHRLRSAPESFLDPTIDAEFKLLEQHREMLNSRPARGSRKEWHRGMKQLRESIRQRISDRAAAVHQLGRALQERERQSRIIRSRESSFILFPEKDIAGRLTRLLPGSC